MSPPPPYSWDTGAEDEGIGMEPLPPPAYSKCACGANREPLGERIAPLRSGSSGSGIDPVKKMLEIEEEFQRWVKETQQEKAGGMNEEFARFKKGIKEFKASRIEAGKSQPPLPKGFLTARYADAVFQPPKCTATKEWETRPKNRGDLKAPVPRRAEGEGEGQIRLPPFPTEVADEDDDPELQMALAMSLEDQRVDGGGEVKGEEKEKECVSPKEIELRGRDKGKRPVVTAGKDMEDLAGNCSFGGSDDDFDADAQHIENVVDLERPVSRLNFHKCARLREEEEVSVPAAEFSKAKENEKEKAKEAKEEDDFEGFDGETELASKGNVGADSGENFFASAMMKAVHMTSGLPTKEKEEWATVFNVAVEAEQDERRNRERHNRKESVIQSLRSMGRMIDEGDYDDMMNDTPSGSEGDTENVLSDEEALKDQEEWSVIDTVVMTAAYEDERKKMKAETEYNKWKEEEEKEEAREKRRKEMAEKERRIEEATAEVERCMPQAVLVLRQALGIGRSAGLGRARRGFKQFMSTSAVSVGSRDGSNRDSEINGKAEEGQETERGDTSEPATPTPPSKKPATFIQGPDSSESPDPEPESIAKAEQAQEEKEEQKPELGATSESAKPKPSRKKPVTFIVGPDSSESPEPEPAKAEQEQEPEQDTQTRIKAMTARLKDNLARLSAVAKAFEKAESSAANVDKKSTEDTEMTAPLTDTEAMLMSAPAKRSCMSPTTGIDNLSLRDRTPKRSISFDAVEDVTSPVKKARTSEDEDYARGEKMDESGNEDKRKTKEQSGDEGQVGVRI